MRGRFFTALQNLEISSALGRGDRLDETTYITNDREVIRRILPDVFLPIIGRLEANHLYSAPAVIYSNEFFDDAIKPEAFLMKKISLVHSFLTTIWMFQDNSINSELSFLLYGKENFEHLHSNFLGRVHSDARGRKKVLNINRFELKKIRNFFRNRVSIFEIENDYLTRLGKGVPRVTRAHYHVSGARIADDLAIKLTRYCSALEALFSVSPAELAHQLSERVACFLEDEPERRLEIYKTVKTAYAIRSTIVHGATLRGGKLDTLSDISAQIDALVRRSLIRAYSSKEMAKIFDGSPEQMDDYMLRRIFNVDVD